MVTQCCTRREKGKVKSPARKPDVRALKFVLGFIIQATRPRLPGAISGLGT